MNSLLSKYHLNVQTVWAGLLILLPVFTVVFIPRPPVGGAQFLIVPVMGFVCAIVILLPKNLTLKRLDVEVLSPVIAIFLLLSMVAGISQLVNISDIRTTGIVTIFRPVLLLLLFLLGVILSLQISKETLYKSLYYTGVILIVGNLVISITQALGIPIFDFIYNAEKSRAIGQIFRVTGTVNNPNLFGFIILQASILVLLFKDNKFKYIWLFFGFVLILASGSRSQLLVFPVFIIITLFLSKPKLGIWFLTKYLLILILIFVTLFSVLFFFSDTFRYMAQILILLEGGNIQGISSIAARFTMWETGWANFHAAQESYKWLIGLGSRPEFQVGDSDYFYTIWHYGIIGLIVLLIKYLILFLFLRNCKDYNLRALGLSLLLLLFLLGFQSETMSGWSYPLNVMFFIGLSYGYQSKKMKQPI